MRSDISPLFILVAQVRAIKRVKRVENEKWSEVGGGGTEELKNPLPPMPSDLWMFVKENPYREKRWSFQRKYLTAFNYFPKSFVLNCLTGFWMWFWHVKLNEDTDMLRFLTLV